MKLSTRSKVLIALNFAGAIVNAIAGVMWATFPLISVVAVVTCLSASGFLVYSEYKKRPVEIATQYNFEQFPPMANVWNEDLPGEVHYRSSLSPNGKEVLWIYTDEVIDWAKRSAELQALHIAADRAMGYPSTNANGTWHDPLPEN